ncbi:MAG: TetR/AcrR family transcriptional regulator [Solobacterium sp.]|nr:TetR/AcrR family transcriptional regulator [Solobacterium sp.]MBR3358611.1 TetR/AcrR family transcriptional regulator [Solobacterium sp.]
MKPTNDAYRNLSCQYITEALFRLMEKENFSDITISEITQEAGVARRTFYLNYTSKEDILDQHYETLIREYDSNFTEELQNDLLKHSAYFFTFWKNHRDYALLLEKNGMLHMLIRRFHYYLDRTGTGAPDLSSDPIQKYASSYFAGGLFMILQTWLQRDYTETPEQLAEYFCILSNQRSASE